MTHEAPRFEPPRAPEARPSSGEGHRLFGAMGVEIHSPDSAHESSSGIGITLAITGLILWAVQTYIVHPVPAQVSAAIYIVVPSAVGWITSHVTFKKKVTL